MQKPPSIARQNGFLRAMPSGERRLIASAVSRVLASLLVSNPLVS